MEFPELGKHCSEQTCKQLDFLPMKCDACNEVFCKNHINYSNHNCPSAYKKDVQVPVCPLCNKPVPGKRGEAPDIAVSGHIDRDCQSDPAVKKRKVYANRCNVKGCKKKELVPVVCDSCRLNYCLRHRHQTDHDCCGFQGSGRSISNPGAAAISRTQSGQTKSSGSRSRSRPQQTSLSSIGQNLDRERRERVSQSHPPRTQSSTQSIQGGMSEDEAMARAIQLSLVSDQTRPTSVPRKPNEEARAQEEEDMALARAIAASEEEQRRQHANRRQQQSQQSDSKCVTS